MTRPKRNLRMDLEYDGSDFAGWAKQPGLQTIEGTLEQVLGRILQEQVGLTVAGRTDAGVHARGQVVSFLTGSGMEPGRLRWSVNGLLPDTIAVSSITEAPLDFDARRSAGSRSYSYTLLCRPWPSAYRHRFVNFIRSQLDTALLHSAAAAIAGRHDFRAFTPTVTEHSYFQREIMVSRWHEDVDLLVYTIEASSFLRGMVRALVGTMLEVGRGRRPLRDLRELLAGGERSQAGESAPPGGLCLEQVLYQSSSKSKRER